MLYFTAERINISVFEGWKGGAPPLKTTLTPHVGMVSMPSPPPTVPA